MSFIDYSNIIGYVEDKINIINTLPANEAALVAAMANLLAGRNNPPSNMLALETYLQGKENLVTDADLVKDVTLLLGASLPSKNTVWKMREFLVNDNFTVPLNIAGDVVYVTGCGGGSSGQAVVNPPAQSGDAIPGWSGCFVDRAPLQVTAGAVIPVTIGTGGAAQSISGGTAAVDVSAVASGGDTTFGTLLTIKGGERRRGAWSPASIGNANTSGQSSIRFVGGFGAQNSGFANAKAYGAPAGAFGNAPNGATLLGVNGTATDAPANSGASGASICIQNNTAGALTATSGAGGSGRIIVEWQEFV